MSHIIQWEWNKWFFVLVINNSAFASWVRSPSAALGADILCNICSFSSVFISCVSTFIYYYLCKIHKSSCLLTSFFLSSSFLFCFFSSFAFFLSLPLFYSYCKLLDFIMYTIDTIHRLLLFLFFPSYCCYSCNLCFFKKAHKPLEVVSLCNYVLCYYYCWVKYSPPKKQKNQPCNAP